MKEMFPGVLLLEDNRIATPNLVPGVRVYDEDLFQAGGREYRAWNPTRSKLGAYLLKGARKFPVTPQSKVLYLGAANGTTVSHVSDIVTRGFCTAVEFSPRSFRDLIGVAEKRQNLIPVLADAWRPDQYARLAPSPDLVFQDIAQRQQSAIFAKNLNHFKPQWGLIAIKARSVDVAANPRDVYEAVVREVEAATPYRVEDVVDLGPFEKDHAAALFKREKGDG
ncbi:MAG TPA: fibrillarin-like rRNA/tRNA 2'-O-methyltransferase [Candidatus Thermoplasmatota archaeon]|nr:fibrillarin-like rRNA/tRNA 2'-O-methyltransferase [Candidatus Thermoplasmatota archaeon]